MADPIADMFIRIKNAQAVKKKTVVVPYSKLKMEIAKLFADEQFIKSAARKGKKNKIIELELLYNNGEGRIQQIKRVSKSSCRSYAGYKDIKPVKQGRGLLIVSTPKGIMSGKKARASKLGGEIIGEVY